MLLHAFELIAIVALDSFYMAL
jgi:hypothetical protein